MADPASNTNSPALDPVFVHARREAIIILSTWVVCLLWTIPTCLILGYGKSAEEVTFILGIPRWVFIGIVAPWAAAAVFSIGFVLFVMKDDDLGEDMMAADEGGTHSGCEDDQRAKPQAAATESKGDE